MRTFISLILSLLILSSCHSNKPSSPLVSANSNEKQILFFSDEENLQNEGNYYDALLELKKKYPVEISKMMVISVDESKMFTKYNVNEYPSLLIVQENKVIKKIQGRVAIDEIIVPIEKALSK